MLHFACLSIGVDLNSRICAPVFSRKSYLQKLCRCALIILSRSLDALEHPSTQKGRRA